VAEFTTIPGLENLLIHAAIRCPTTLKSALEQAPCFWLWAKEGGTEKPT
jgi:hypothetical protein